MGSKFMENRELTELILRDLKSKGLMFVDSKTSSESKGYETLGVLLFRWVVKHLSVLLLPNPMQRL